MAEETLTLNLPDTLYQRLKKRADAEDRSVEEVVIETLVSSVPEEDGIPPELEHLLNSMASLDDATLWRAAKNDLAREAAEEIRRLRAKRERKGLTLDERQRYADLLRQYDRGILIRAEAAALLKQRGHDVDVLRQHS